jgi:adenine-specific DNA-methyltransferase
MPTLDFKGKSAVQYHHLAVPHHQLVPSKKNSLTDRISLNDNLIVQGDNLLALKALLPTYGGKVKCIYIDPPYNTGNEAWVYNDKVNSPIIKDWIGQVVGKEGEDFTRHDKWLCMMLPRLKLLRELLSEDGVIFVSIDDNEQHHLRELMDEIFGEQNFVANFIWNHRKSSQNDTDLSLSHNHTITYAKNRDIFKLYSLGIDESKFSNPDNDPRGKWIADPFDAPNIRPNLTYPVINPNTGVEFMPPQGRCWRMTEEKFKAALTDDRVVWGKNGKTKPQIKRFLVDAQNKGSNPFTIWADIETATDATKELMNIFEGSKVFDTPKPVDLIKRILHLSTDKDSIVLDSFAGSGTTAQAVLELNKEDGGNRKFILVEMEDYANNITAERVRRVIKGVPTAKKPLVKQGLRGTFSYFELGDPIQLNNLLAGNKLPSWLEMARYVFYTTTGEEFDDKNAKPDKFFAGKTETRAIYVFYKPNIKWLKDYKFTLKEAEELRTSSGTSKHITVYAPAKYVDSSSLEELNMSFCQLPYEIYKLNSK